MREHSTGRGISRTSSAKTLAGSGRRRCLRREADAAAALALALSHLPIALADGDGRIAVLEDALAIAEQAGDPFVLGTALNNLGVESAERGNTGRARELFEESFRVRAEIGDLARMALSLSNLAETAFGAGDLTRARDYAQPRRWHLRATSVSGARPAALSTTSAGSRSQRAASPRRASCSRRRSRSRWRSAACPAPHPARTSRCRRGKGRRAPSRRGSRRLPGPAFTGTRSWGRGQALFERHLAAARAQTDPAEWDAAWGAGGALTIEQAAAEVLGT